MHRLSSSPLVTGLFAVLLAGLSVASPGCESPPQKLAQPEVPPPDAPLVRELLCLSVHLPMDDAEASRAERARQLDHAEALGVRILRRDLHWHRLEPAPGELHWEAFDAGVNDITDRGLELLALLVYGVPWAAAATEDDTNYPPDDPADYARYAGRVAERYADRVRLFEVWNEPNNGWRFWKPTVGGDPEAYGALLHAAAAAIRTAHPDPVVLYGGTVFHEQVVIPSAVAFMQDHFAAWPEAAADFDAVGFHPYPWYPPAVPPEETSEPEMPIWQMMDALRGVLAEHGGGGKPLYATEFGWPSHGTVSEDLQAAWLARETLWLAAGGARAACWYTLYDGPGGGAAEAEDHFGLIAWDPEAGTIGEPKPAYYALRTLSATFGDTAFLRDETDALGMAPAGHALLFATRDGSVRVHALWTVGEGSEREVRVPVRAAPPLALGSQVRCLDALGQEITPVEEDAAVRLTVGPMPVYVVDTGER